MTAEFNHEAIAVQIHEFYRAKYGDSPSFSQLPEFMKVDNLEAALRIGKVLSVAGLRLEARNGAEWKAEDQQRIRNIIQTPSHRELLAEAEHRGWMEARLRHGWVKADKVDRERKESHLLVPFSEFEQAITKKQQVAGPAIHHSGDRKGQPMSIAEEIEAEKDKDRNSVGNYVEFIAKTNYWIVEED